jgi:hypothetical protein
VSDEQAPPALISIVKGTPTEEELAAVLAVLFACADAAPEPRASCRARRPGWGSHERVWRAPAAWSPGMRRWSVVR